MFNNCTNIDGINDEQYDNAIKRMLDAKELERIIENPGIFPEEMQNVDNYTINKTNKEFEKGGDE